MSHTTVRLTAISSGFVLVFSMTMAYDERLTVHRLVLRLHVSEGWPTSKARAEAMRMAALLDAAFRFDQDRKVMRREVDRIKRPEGD